MGGNIWTFVFLFSLSSIDVSNSKPTSNENIYIDQGWRPVTKEEVFNKIQRRFSYVPLEEDLSTSVSKNSVLILLNLSREDNEKLTIENKSNPPLSKKQNLDMDYKMKEKSKHSIADDNNLKEFTNTMSDKSLRKPKKIPEEIIVSEQSLVNFQKTLRGEDKDLQNKYEVIEALNAKEALQSTSEPKYGYVYNPPALKPFPITNNNLTSHFLNILSKYNIKADDDLPNYALSTQRTRLFSPGHIDLIPLRNSRRYNSLNHLTVDPMLAVFLSNYGYYLPGVYGFRNNYRNLYGHLALNNLHNNKPFGCYKISSDNYS